MKGRDELRSRSDSPNRIAPKVSNRSLQPFLKKAKDGDGQEEEGTSERKGILRPAGGCRSPRGPPSPLFDVLNKLER